MNILYMIDVFLCAIPVPQSTMNTHRTGGEYIKLAFFYMPIDGRGESRQIQSRVYWNYHFLSECNIGEYSFQPVKQANHSSKAKLKKFVNLDKAFNVLDRITVKPFFFLFL